MISHTSRRFHIVVDAFDCDSELLSNAEAIKDLLIKLADLAEMHILKGPVVAEGISENPGITAFAIIDFSHISIHTFTSSNEFCLDLFSCKRFNYNKVTRYIKSFFKLDDSKMHTSLVRYEQIPVERISELFDPSEYLNEYYAKLSSENQALLSWYHKTYSELALPKKAHLLEVGGGPTLYQLISAALKVESITFTDYLPENLQEITKWRNADNSAFDWSRYIQFVLNQEDEAEEITIRSELIRNKIESIKILDLNEMDDDLLGKFDIVQSNFCPESATDDVTEYKNMLHNLGLYLKPGATLLMLALEGAIVYKSGDKYFPAIYLDEALLEHYLREAGFEVELMHKIMAEDPSVSKYHGLLCVKAIKSN